MSWPVGLIFAVGAALATNVGFLMRERGASAAPDVDARHPVETVVELFKRKWWSIGFGVAIVSWLLHVTALKLAPLSYVQAALASGFVLLGLVAERWFGFELGKREWTGIGLTTLGLLLLAVTAAGTSTKGEHASYGVAAAIAFEGGLIALGVFCLLSHRVERVRGAHGPLLGAAAGLMFTVSHIGIKALSGQIHVSQPQTLLTPWVAVVVAAFVVAFFASARSLQLGPAVAVIAITGASSNATAILGGIVVFDDPLGSEPFLVAIRIAAFVLVIVAAALIPAPVRAAAHARRQGEAAARTPAPSARAAAEAS